MCTYSPPRCAPAAREGVCVDNLHAGGCGCAVDVETGVVVSDGFNNDFARLREHPLTHVPFKGFQIPMWDEARATVEKIARKAYLLPAMPLYRLGSGLYAGGRCRDRGQLAADLRSDPVRPQGHLPRIEGALAEIVI